MKKRERLKQVINLFFTGVIFRYVKITEINDSFLNSRAEIHGITKTSSNAELTVKTSEVSYSQEEMEALGLEDTYNEARLVVGLTNPYSNSSNPTLSFEEKNLAEDSKIPLNIEPKTKITLVRHKSDLTNPRWVDKYIKSLRGGVDSKLIKSILSKIEDSGMNTESVNKILLRISEISMKVGMAVGNKAFSIALNKDLLRILHEFEKPFPPTDFLKFPQAEGFILNPKNSLSPR